MTQREVLYKHKGDKYNNKYDKTQIYKREGSLMGDVNQFMISDGF